MEKAILGGGCFWCTEAVFQNVKGVYNIISGYSGGKRENPTYEQICSGATGHAEVIGFEFNSREILYEEILEIFWKTHDPTTLNRQGNDVGTQYRSVIFYINESQKEIALKYKKQLDEQHVFLSPIVTEISPLINFFEAEGYHQNYYRNHPTQGYCNFVVRPKLGKFKEKFADKIK